MIAEIVAETLFFVWFILSLVFGIIFLAHELKEADKSKDRIQSELRIEVKEMREEENFTPYKTLTNSVLE